MLEFIVAVGLIVLTIFCFNKAIQSKRNRSNTKMYQNQNVNNLPKVTYSTPSVYDNSIDSLNLPSSFSLEMCNHVRKVANDYAKRYITQEDLQNYTVKSISDDFSSMPGWDIWDISVHSTDGQIQRLERAVQEPSHILLYDPECKIAKIQGGSDTYLVSFCRCSCPDFRKRHLPCKHMYSLALELDGDVRKHICNEPRGELRGLKFALAGSFSNKDGSSVKSIITDRGGMWTDKVTISTSALVVGNRPSEYKLSFAKEYDMEIIPQDKIESFLANCEDK